VQHVDLRGRLDELAPGLLSTITGCFSDSASACPTLRATTSTAPPAA
jgi:hypothetical protein